MWDNIDRLEETITGKDTSHRVNGIAVQPRVFGPQPSKTPAPEITKSKQRSLNVENVPLPLYVPGERVGPLSEHTWRTAYSGTFGNA